MATTYCLRCKTNKPNEEFHKSKTRKNGLNFYCIQCQGVMDAEYYLKNRKRILAKKRQQYHENPEFYKEVYQRNRSQMRSEMIREYGGKCSCCGESAFEFLTLEHPNGDGVRDRVERTGRNSGGYRLYASLKRDGWPKVGYDLLCMNCNWARGMFGYCPHQKEK